MVSTSCIAGKINQLITAERIKEAEDLFLQFRNKFGDDFYGEIQFNELTSDHPKFNEMKIDQRFNNKHIIDLCNKYDVPIMIGGDVHYLDKGDGDLQDAIINSKRQAKEGEEGFQIHARHLYYHDVSDYYDFDKKFGYNYGTDFLEKCFENSVKFSDKVNFEFETGKYHLPKININNGMTSDEYIEKVTWEGLVSNIEIERKYFPSDYTNEEIDVLEKQTEYELKVLKEMGLSDYMLMVYDIIKFEKENDIYVGAGRGCFLPNSKVTLFNNSKLEIKYIQKGDKILNHFSGFGIVSNKFIYNIEEEIIELQFDNGKIITCTKDHEIYTHNRSWVKACEINNLDFIVDLDYSIVKILNKRFYNYKGLVYDLEIQSEKNDHSYNIENIVVHNSAAGSVVAWALGITGLNPLKHGLMFERFVNPNRKQMADIDWDTEQGGREKILEYLVKTYGREAVSNVVTYGTYGPKSALSDMSRGLRKDTGHDTILMRKITKLPEIDDANNLIDYFNTISKNNNDPEISDWIAGNQDTIKFANKLVGQMKSIGTHAGGIVITPGPIYDFLPVTRGNGNLVTAFSEADGSSKDLSELGILKLDVLGLKTMNILKECVKKIFIDKDIDIKEKLFHLPLDDKKMIDYFSTGNNYGIFQMDRSAMFTSKFKSDGGQVDSFEDIVAINAMNRPGPLEKFLPKYGYWKAIDKGKVKLSEEELRVINKERYPFPFMEKILSSTYGAALYQEQIMQIFCELTGMNFGESDSFRRAIAWKPDNPKYYTVKGYFDRLEEAMKQKGYNDEDKEFLLKYLRDASGYNFNRSHSLAYSYISWQTLYLKVYYPAYFYSAMLNIEDKEDKIQEIIEDAKKNAIKILPLSIAKSEYNCKAASDDSIRLGYKLIRGCGDAVKDEIEQFEMHKCNSIEEILQKPFKKINKSVLDNLIKLGCFDEFGIDRDMIELLKSLYKEPKIEKWFTRKKGIGEEKNMPEILSDNFEKSIVILSLVLLDV